MVDKKTVKNFKVNQRLNTHSKGSEVDLLSNSSKMVHMEENARKQTAKQAPEENEVLYSVIAHISLGIVGIAVLSGMIASVKDGKFAHDHSVLSVINGVLTLVVMFSWYYLFLGLGALMGQQAVYEWYTMGMMLFVIASFGGPFIQRSSHPLVKYLLCHGSIRLPTDFSRLICRNLRVDASWLRWF